MVRHVRSVSKQVAKKTASNVITDIDNKDKPRSIAYSDVKDGVCPFAGVGGVIRVIHFANSICSGESAVEVYLEQGH